MVNYLYYRYTPIKKTKENKTKQKRNKEQN